MPGTWLRTVVGTLAVVALGALSGCRSPESTGRAHIARGDAYFAEKKFAEAAIEYRSAIQVLPTSADAYYKLGETNAARSDVVAALAAYVRAADLNPDLLDAQVKAAQLLLLARKYDDARTRLRHVLSKEPNNATALLMLANALAGLSNLDEAVAANTRAVALDPTRAGVYINLGALQYIRGRVAEAESAYLAAVKADPSSLDAKLGLADFYFIDGRTAQAERAYLEALKAKNTDPLANRAVARFYIRSGRLRQAEPFMRRAAELSRTTDDWFNLVDYYVATRRRGVALQILEGLRREKATYVDATVKIAFIRTLEGKPLDALRLVDEVIAAAPSTASALALKTHLLLARRKRLDALATAENAVAADRKSEAAHFAHAAAAAANRQRDVAKGALLEVLNLNPNSTEALIELAKLMLDQGLVDTALQYAEQAVTTNPSLVEAQLVRLRVLANHSGQRDDASKLLSTLLAKYPTSPEVQYEAGLTAVAQGDAARASRYFERARQLRPAYTDPLIELIKLDVEGKNVGQARRRVDEVLSKAPNSIEARLIAGTTYAMIDPAIAERHLRSVLELDASNITAYETLAALFMSQNKLEQAKAEFINLTKQQPSNVAPATMVGILCEAMGNRAEAEQWYQQALKIDGRAATAANNLAWMYADEGRNLEAAVELATIARGELPRQPEVTDTLGWAYLKKGFLEQAVRTLQDAVQQSPNTPLFHYHLGLAYSLKGEDGRARQSLQQALKLDPKFPQAADAQRALAKLLY